jgi:hypothetical protein
MWQKRSALPFPLLGNFPAQNKWAIRFCQEIEANQHLLNGNFDFKTALGSN